MSEYIILKERVREALAKFDKAIRQDGLSLPVRIEYSHCLWDFFSRFPKRTGPEQIYTTDIADYLEELQAAGASHRKQRGEINNLHKFFNFCIKELGIEMANPVPRTWSYRKPVQPAPSQSLLQE